MSGKSTRIGLAVDSDSSLTEWQRVKSLSDAEIDAAIEADPSAYAIETEMLGHSSGQYHYVIFRDEAGAWRWKLAARDGTVLAEAPKGRAWRKAVLASIAKLRWTLSGAELAA
mgnify:CR=1 FL=1